MHYGKLPKGPKDSPLMTTPTIQLLQYKHSVTDVVVHEKSHLEFRSSSAETH